ncbi:MAG: hypothetical protein KF858_10805 [Candidatus Sumerlaeia bacterium]|nr:hypothetical protein [Candidatus Sumerlaeia bacterium]
MPARASAHPLLQIVLAGLLVLVAPGPALAEPVAPRAGSRVVFDAAGIAQVNGQPFFPIGLYTYHLDATVLAEMHALRFNTILNGFRPDQLDTIHEHGLMAVCHTGDEWIAAARNHPALLAWYLYDEPEGHGRTPEEMRLAYLRMKQIDPSHPVGLCHFLYEALEDYRDARDFSITDVYPVTANRDVPLLNVGIHAAQARATNRNGGPNWTCIQVFGGPETEGGKWAQPTPREVRAMTFIALVHGSTGILYFSYWPKAPETWRSLGDLNRDLRRMVPWLVAEGTELETGVSNRAIHVRARQVGEGGIAIAVNTAPEAVDSAIFVRGTGTRPAQLLFEGGTIPIARSNIRDRFGPYQERVYVWGPEATSMIGEESAELSLTAPGP